MPRDSRRLSCSCYFQIYGEWGPSRRPANLYEQLAGAITSLLSTPGPVVVGAAPGASCIGPVYELAFELDRPRRQRKLRRLLEAAPKSETSPITLRSRSRRSPQTPSPQVKGSPTPMASPPSTTTTAVTPPKASVPSGLPSALPPATEIPVPVNFPQTGHMTGQLADIAARDLAARLDRREGAATELSTHCLLAMGDRGAHMAVDPVRPPIRPQPRPLATQQLLDNTERPCQPLPPAKARLA